MQKKVTVKETIQTKDKTGATVTRQVWTLQGTFEQNNRALSRAFKQLQKGDMVKANGTVYTRLSCGWGY